MKKTIFLIAILTVGFSSFSQTRAIARGEQGELYHASQWYGIYGPWGPPDYEILRTALYRITQNGKKLTIQYDSDYFESAVNDVKPQRIMADVTPGIIYNLGNEYTSSLSSLWVSFDYGINWILRDTNVNYPRQYIAANVPGVIYKASGQGSGFQRFKSNDCAENFSSINYGPYTNSRTDPGLIDCEFFWLSGYGTSASLLHTLDCFATYSSTPISDLLITDLEGDSHVFRGALPSEVFISTWIPIDYDEYII